MHENQSMLKELLDKYTQNKISEQEFSALCELIGEQGNDNLLMYILNKDLNTASQHSMDKAHLDVMLKKINVSQPSLQTENSVKTAVVRKMSVWRQVAAAVLVILIAGTGWLYTKKQNSLKKDTSPQVTAKVNDNKGKPITDKNNSTAVKAIQLYDGSIVELTPGSEISYTASFAETGRREINLFGEAIFKVKKDKAHPFIVHAGGISTTVLGTVFRVRSNPSSGKEFVQLYEGKVLVELKNKEGQGILLTPGQQCENKQGQFVVTKFENLTPLANSARKEPGQKTLEIVDGWYVFNNHPLDKVLDELSKLYRIVIVFDRKEIKNKFFIGKFRGTENVKDVLSSICELNSLKLQKENNTYFIVAQ